ncbi:baseplate J/gp47 family protein [Xanthobacter sp. VTT E-85241]|uniref:baseplate J/gp47 family protein n=1 Tax=Roseixanthobacter finlandensis TaxID=3119922 RepID=UPI00372BB41C
MSLDPSRAYTLSEIIAAGEPAFFETNPLALKARIVARAESLMDRTLYEGQVEMYMAEVIAYALSIRASELQFAVVQRLLPWARGKYLEALAARVGVYRLKAVKAGLTVQLIIDAPRPSTVIIPAGTRVRGRTSGAIFLTDSPSLIQPGSMIVTVHATAAGAGEEGNGVVAGTVMTVLDGLPVPATATAVTTSTGGAAEEQDDRLRERAAGAWETISRGGPREGYRQLALKAHQDIIDVAVIRPQPCDIDIYVLTEVMPPGPEIIAAVFAACDPRTGRPEGDEVDVMPATAVTIAATLNLWVDGEPEAIQPLAEAAFRGVFAAWRRILGPRLATGAAVEACKAVTGVVEATVEGWSYSALDEEEYAVLTSLSVETELA